MKGDRSFDDTRVIVAMVEYFEQVVASVQVIIDASYAAIELDEKNSESDAFC